MTGEREVIKQYVVGPAGSVVKLKFARQNESFVVQLTRRQVLTADVGSVVDTVGGHRHEVFIETSDVANDASVFKVFKEALSPTEGTHTQMWYSECSTHKPVTGKTIKTLYAGFHRV